MNFRDRLRVSNSLHTSTLLKEAKEFRLNNPESTLDEFLKSRGGLWAGYVELDWSDARLYQNR